MDKQDLRGQVWDRLEDQGVARFPFPPHGRIPNFAGADEAADRLMELEAWREAAVIKSNPDSPQRPVRRSALQRGKVIYMAVPRLRDVECFLRLDPSLIDDIDHATTISGSADVGEPVSPDEMEPIDFIVCGSVAVTETGIRIGKGEGYSDLEYAILRELALLDADVPVATTVHECQLIDEDVPPDPHDVPLDYVITPERSIRTDRTTVRPTGIAWSQISEEQRAEIPVLDLIQEGTTNS